VRSSCDGVIAITSMVAVGVVLGFLGGVVADTGAVALPIAAIVLNTHRRRFCRTPAADHHVRRPNQDHERLPMTDHTSTGSCASRWDALLAENSILDREHMDLLSSYTPPFSAQQIAQLEASAARRAELPKKIRKLVEEWTRSASL
jgi:hypothetical protein